METILHFQKPGMHTLIQDLGRPGHQSSGVPASGVLDRTSAEAANWCVGNLPSAPVFEITMIGPQIRFEGDCWIAIAGAEIDMTLDDEPVHRYETIPVASGAVLSFGKLHSGCRAYLAVGGNWQVTHWLGSASALSIGHEDLVAGAVVKKDDSIRVILPESEVPLQKSPDPIQSWPAELAVHIMPGPEFQAFSAQQIAFFFSTAFILSGDSNRIGYRLEPVLPDYTANAELISSGVIPGTVQVTRQGQPVILMADAQTTGGYPRIANVVSAELDALAQLKPGDTIHFKAFKKP